MSNNLVNQSTKAISTNELRRIGPVLAVVSSGLMDLFFVIDGKKLNWRKIFVTTSMILKIYNNLVDAFQSRRLLAIILIRLISQLRLKLAVFVGWDVYAHTD